MGAYNKFRGQYCCHNEHLVNRILKGEWNFDGSYISDWAELRTRWRRQNSAVISRWELLINMTSFSRTVIPRGH